MPAAPELPDTASAVHTLMELLSVEGVTGQEAAIAARTAEMLRAVGVPGDAIRYDDAHTRIPLPTQTGNLIVQLPGTRPGPRLLFSTHLDTVPLAAGAVPVRSGNKIRPQGATALGGDNRTGVACLVTLVATLLRHRLPHPPLTLLFTVREESGLFGARYLDTKALGKVQMGFNIDGKKADELTIAAVGAERWEVEIFGKAAHAGVHPEQGISATLVAALALASVRRQGYFGKIAQQGKEGTSNVGSLGGKDGKAAGDATNVVTDYVRLTGEARSHDRKFVKQIVSVYKSAFLEAAGEVLDDKGKKAKVKFTSRLDYHPFRLEEDAPVVLQARKAAQTIGLQANLRLSNGGLDANWLVKHGIPTITFGAGQNQIHTIDEFVQVPDYLQGCRLALALATLD